MRRCSQNPNQLELFDFRRSQEVRAEACFPMGFQIRDTVLRMAQLNAGLIEAVINKKNGDKPPVASIADCSGYARVERTGPNPIWIGLVQFSFKHLNTRRRALGSRTGRRNGLSLPMRPQITESETGSQQHHPGDNVSDLPHPNLKTTHADCNTRFPRGEFRQVCIQVALQETPDAKSG